MSRALPQMRVAEWLLIKHHLLILNRSKQRAPAFRMSDRVIAGLLPALIRPARLVRSAIVLKPSTIMRFRGALVRRSDTNEKEQKNRT